MSSRLNSDGYLENLSIDSEGDTVRVNLSPEIIEIHEATEANSWQVIDTKGLELFMSDTFTDEEENQVKRRIGDRSKRFLYQNGTIERARLEGAQNLRTLLEKIYRKPVEVIDNTPKGAYYNEYQ